jgi:hypothetical protein
MPEGLTVSCFLSAHSFQVLAMMRVYSEYPHGRGQNGRACHKSQQAKHFDSAKHTDEQQQLIQMGAIAQQQGSHDIVRNSCDAAANQQNQEAF